MDARLADGGPWLLGDDYSIADIAIWPWMSRFEWQTIDLKQYPNVKRWYETIAKRPAAHPTVLLTSSEKGEGIKALRTEIAMLLESGGA